MAIKSKAGSSSLSKSKKKTTPIKPRKPGRPCRTEEKNMPGAKKKAADKEEKASAKLAAKESKEKEVALAMTTCLANIGATTTESVRAKRAEVRKGQEIRLLPDRLPWDFHPWETSLAFTALQQYLAMGVRRSVARLGWERLSEQNKIEYVTNRGLPVECIAEYDANKAAGNDNSIPGGAKNILAKCGALQTWSAQYMWQERARLWDEHLLRLEQKRFLEARIEARDRAVEQGKTLQALGMKQVDKMVNNPNLKLNTRDTIALIEAGHKLEKSGLGLDDETAAKINNTMNVQQFNFGNVSDNELDQMIAIMGKISGPGSLG